MSDRSMKEVLDADYLLMRHELIGLAAAFDRVARSGGFSAGDGRWQQLRRAVALLADEGPDRAARMQMHFSDPYP